MTGLSIHNPQATDHKPHPHSAIIDGRGDCRVEKLEMDGDGTMSVKEALAQLEKLTPDAPFLALGQTIFWDEPMKAGIALASRRIGYGRRFIAGVHDTDYFAKLPSGKRQPGKFKALPHNDTATQGLWSAAGEFSSLFGSETVITRDSLLKAGLKIGKIVQKRPDFLDEATEAWGWKGIVSLDDNPPITAELPLKQVLPTLQETLDWALDSSVACLAGEGKETAERLADEIRTMLCDADEELLEEKPKTTLADLYRRLAPAMYSFAASTTVSIETTATTELLRFNVETASLPRFELLNLFVAEATRKQAEQAYDQAVQGSGLYELKRFGTGAVPFDVILPGIGRGTLRITKRAVIVMTPQPQFITLRKPLQNVQELAAALERKFGPNCVAVGKAVTLIGMLAREFVFVFHEGASAYVQLSRKLHQALKLKHINPILRVRYSAWDALQVCCSWLTLPEPFQGPFGARELCAPSLAGRWRAVGEEQKALLATLGELRRPVELLQFLEGHLGGSWKSLAEEYKQLHDELETRAADLEAARKRRLKLYEVRRKLKVARLDAERASGDHFKQFVFEKAADGNREKEREKLQARVEAVRHEAQENERAIRGLMHEQREISSSEEILKAHDRRRSIEVESELARLHLIRSAIISSQGLKKAGQRPSAWWLRLVCPDGLWFRQTVDSAECYLEPLF